VVLMQGEGEDVCGMGGNGAWEMGDGRWEMGDERLIMAF